MVVLLVFVVGNYLIYLKTGQLPLNDMKARLGSDWLVDLRELMSFDSLSADAKSALKDLKGKYVEPEPIAPVKVYKWTDVDGQVHFGDKPGANTAEQIEVEMRNGISAPERGVSPAAGAKGGIVGGESNTASPAGGESALDKARAAAEAMQQRNQAQEQVY